MSTLKTNTLTGTTSAGSIVVTGEGGSTTTNLQQGLAKVWNCFDDDAVLRDSHNTASVTDNGTGHFDTNLTSNFDNDDFVFNGTVGVFASGSSPQIVGGSSATAKDTGQYGIRTQNYAGTFQDREDMMTSAHGDLA